jgi:aryl-alcohol dehydrogenase-like predicted oxidoreductase
MKSLGPALDVVQHAAHRDEVEGEWRPGTTAPRRRLGRRAQQHHQGYNTGILADPSPGALYNYRTASPEVLERVRRIQMVCARHGVPLKAAAIQFPFGHPAVTSVLTGVRSVAELDENARMLRLPIPADLWAELHAERLLPEEVPVPQ